MNKKNEIINGYFMNKIPLKRLKINYTIKKSIISNSFTSKQKRMKPGVKQYQTKGKNIRSQNDYQVGFIQSQITELHSDPIKGSEKMRVPFIQLLNQQQQAVANGKLYKKASIGYMPPPKTQQQNCPQQASSSKNKDSKNAKQTSLIVNSKPSVQNNYKIQGTNSIQLIKVVESSQADGQKSSSCTQKRYKIEINEQAVMRLLQRESLQEDLSFCTIVGKTKTGKSFLLNRLINLLEDNQQNQQKESSAFSVDHTLAPCTKGIWISQQSFSLSTMSTRQKSKQVFFLDTPGLGSYDSTQQLDYKLLTLSILMADVLVYNSIGPIDQHMLNGMSLAVEISKLIVQEQEKGKNVKTESIVNLPALLWLLRDFSLELLTADNKEISENQYLEKCLQMESKQNNINAKNGNNKVKSKQNIRSAIKSIFTSRQCSSLVMPFDEQGQVREQFREKLIEVKTKLLGLVDDNNINKQKSNSIKTISRIQEFIFRLRAFVQFLNCQSSSTKKSFQFPKFQSLQTSLNKAKVLHQFTRVNENYNRLFVKYEQSLDNLQSSVDCKQQYLRKVEKLRKRLEEEVMETRSYFQLKIQEMIQGDKQGVGKVMKSKQIGSRNNVGVENQFRELLTNSSKDPLINVVSQRYFAQCNTLRLRFSQIDEKIIKNAESFRQQRSEDEQIDIIKEQINRSIEIYNATSSVAELKRVYESSIKRVKKLIEQNSQQKPSSQTLLKQLQINYLKHKVTLMQHSQLQLSNQSTQSASSDINYTHHSGYKQCTNCQKSLYIPYIIIPSYQLLQIKFLKTIVKEMHREYTQGVGDLRMENQQNGWLSKRLKLEFVIEVELNNKKWYIRRKLKDFIELNNIVGIMFSNQSQQHLLYPSSQFLLSNNNNKNPKSMLKLESLSYNYELSEERARMIKEELKVFLLELNKLDYVRNSRIFQKFVKINKEYLDL